MSTRNSRRISRRGLITGAAALAAHGALADTITPQIGGGINQFDGALGGARAPFPVLANNNYIIVGDSRTANNSDTATLSSTIQNSSGGFLGWLASYMGYAGKCVGNFGVNTETIQGAQLRRTAQGIASGVTPTWRAEYAVNDPALSAALAIFLIGVNNTSEVVATFGPRYDALFGAEIDAGRVVAICNEIPDNNNGGWGTNNLARRDYLDAWPDSSSALTALQKTTYRSKRIIIPTYDALASTPRSLIGKAGIYLDNLHPNARGNRILGDVIGVSIGNLYSQNSFAVRNALPAVGISGATQSVFGQVFTDFTSTSAITAANGESAGTGGANMDGAGGVGVSGVVIKDANSNLMTITRSANLQTALNATQDGSARLNVTTSIVSVNGRNNLRLAITSNGVLLPASGTLQLIASFVRNFSQAQIQALSLNSQTLSGLCRIAFGANQTGLKSCGLLMNVTRPSYTPGQYFTLWDGASVLGDISADAAFDRNVMTNALPLPSDFDTVSGTYQVTSTVKFLLTNGAAIDTTVDLAALGNYPNR